MSKITPYEVSLNDQPFWVVDKPSTREAYLKDHPEMSPDTLGLVAIGIFRLNSYVDYVAIGRVDDVGEDIGWVRAHEAYEWLDWMAGLVYRNPERENQLKDTERRLGRFLVQFGWAADAVLETAPSQTEMDSFIEHVIGKDEVGGQLIMPEEDDE